MAHITREITELTPRYGAKLLFHSFDHSQGKEFAQRPIFQYVKTLHSKWTMTKDLRQQIEEIAFPAFETYLFGKNSIHRHRRIPDGYLEEGIRNGLYLFQETLTDRPKKRRGLVRFLTEIIANLDHRYLVISDGRERSPKWFSYFREYVIMGKTTRIAEFDQMYSDIRKRWLELVDPRDYTLLECELAQRFNRQPARDLHDIAQVWRRETHTSFFTGEPI